MPQMKRSLPPHMFYLHCVVFIFSTTVSNPRLLPPPNTIRFDSVIHPPPLIVVTHELDLNRACFSFREEKVLCFPEHLNRCHTSVTPPPTRHVLHALIMHTSSGRVELYLRWPSSMKIKLHSCCFCLSIQTVFDASLHAHYVRMAYARVLRLYRLFFAPLLLARRNWVNRYFLASHSTGVTSRRVAWLYTRPPISYLVPIISFKSQRNTSPQNIRTRNGYLIIACQPLGFLRPRYRRSLASPRGRDN